MSRVAKIPVTLAKGVDAQVSGAEITVKGPLGTLKQRLTPQVKVEVADGRVSFTVADESREAKASAKASRSD
jgi:large subunit ribosomal protein L6